MALEALLQSIAAGATPWKLAVRVVASSNVTLAALQTVDSVALAEGDRVLCAGQTNGAENGVYVASEGAWVRAEDMKSSSYLKLGTTIRAMEGTANSGIWTLTSPTDGDVRVGVTTLVIAKDSSALVGAEAATAATLVLRDSSARAHVAGVVSDQTTLVCQPADRSTAGVGYGATFAAGQANGSNVGGVTTIGDDNGGTPGTNLAGDVEFQLGTLVSNVSAKARWISGSTTKLEASQTAANLFKINAPSPMVLEIRAAGGGIAITPDSGSILRLGADSAGTQVASQTHVCANASGGLIQTFSPEFYFNHTTIYERTAAASLKLTRTVATAYVYNFASGGSSDWQINGTSKIKIDGTGVGFFAATPAAKPTVIGSRGGNAALASLLTALATLGLITDSSSA